MMSFQDAPTQDIVHLSLEHGTVPHPITDTRQPPISTQKDNFPNSLELSRPPRQTRFDDLNDDVITEIFRAGLFSDPDPLYGRFALAPLRYSCVCRRWRRIALCHSWLWSLITFNDIPPYALTQEFLRRSKSSELTISIAIPTIATLKKHDSSASTKDLFVRLKYLTNHISRWNSLRLSAYDLDYMEKTLAFLKMLDAPKLQRLELRVRRQVSKDDLDAQHFPLFNTIPALRRLSLDMVPTDYKRLVACNNLTELTFTALFHREDMPTVEEFRAVLANCTKLQALRLIWGGGPQWNGEDAYHGPQISLPCLRELDFTYLDDVNGADDLEYALDIQYLLFILSMIKPGATLEHLVLDGLGEDFDLFFPALHKYCQSVDHLQIASIPMDVTAAPRWLNALPKLTHLTVGSDALQDILLEVLGKPAATFGIQTQAGVLCPTLKELSPSYVNATLTESLVERRRMAGFPLETIIWPAPCKDMVKKALGVLQDRVRFEYYLLD